VDLPLSNECKRILAYAAEEAERLHHSHISTEHLLLGMLRETDSFAAEILRMYGIDLAPTRVKIALASMPQIVQIPPHLPKAGCVPDPETAKAHRRSGGARDVRRSRCGRTETIPGGFRK